MEIQLGINPNCSEIVYQLCGVTKEIAQQMKEEFIGLLKDKYKEEYLNDYAAGLFAVPGKYHLGFYSYDGSDSGPDYDTVLEIAKNYPIYNDYVDCCSQPIDTDDAMEKHMEWRKENRDDRDR